MYHIKEIFYTLQGEGANTGRPAIFCRFSGCNLWSGLEKHRATAICSFCDTDFRGTDGPGGGRFQCPEKLAAHVFSFWPSDNTSPPFVVCTGGEPLLQLDEPLIQALNKYQCHIAVETNGTQIIPPGIDWVTVSPKNTAPLIVTTCDELKLVYPQKNAMPEKFSHIQAQYYYLTPMADPHLTDMNQLYNNSYTRHAIQYCLKHPKWRINLQSHKLLSIP